MIVALIANCHGETKLPPLKLLCGVVRLGGHDVVKRRHAVSSTGREKEAEVLRVTVRCANQPESDLCLQKSKAIFFGIVTTVEQVEAFPNARTAIAIVLDRWRHGERLTKVLLRHAQQAAIAGLQSIEALDGKHTDVVESDNLALGHVQPKLTTERETEVLVLDTQRHIEPIGQLAQFGLQNMRGGRRPLGQTPAIIPEQRGLLLSAGDRDTQLALAIGTNSQRRSRKISDDVGHFCIAKGRAFGRSRRRDFSALRDKL